MKSLRNKVLLSGIVLLFALIATIGSTYAWFTVSNTVSVTQFSVTANTEQALLGRVWNTGDTSSTWTSPDDYANTLDILDPGNSGTPHGYYSSGLSSWRLTPVTAVDDPTTSGLTNYTSLDFVGSASYSTDALGLRRVVLNDAATRTYSDYSANVNTASGGYITVKFWLMDPSHDSTIVTLSGLTVTSALNTALANSIYVGVLGDDGTQSVYPVDSDYGFAFTTGQPGYSTTPSTTINSIPSGTISTLQGLEKSAGDNNTIITLTTHGVPQLVTVYIWIEGWDAQATNGIMGYSLNINFNFSIYTP
jgi:hypothetical protein